MRTIRCGVLLVLLLALTSCSSTDYYVVRHAERANNSDDSPLATPAGFTRAAALRDRLADKSIDFIFVSDKRRTQQTAAPTATLFGLNPRIIPSTNTNQLITELRAIRGPTIFTQSVLVVRHSPEIHLIVNALSPFDTITPISGDQFNNLFVVKRSNILWQEEVHLERLTYGASSP